MSASIVRWDLREQGGPTLSITVVDDELEMEANFELTLGGWARLHYDLGGKFKVTPLKGDGHQQSKLAGLVSAHPVLGASQVMQFIGLRAKTKTS